jgi:predicted HAD superfamily Cof-like phosphohydrolase
MYTMANMTNFEKVLEFNESFGVVTNKTPQKDLYDTDTKLVNYRLSLITEEVDELRESILNKDFKETVDALSDILYVVYGAFTAFGINADDAYDLVHKSNMSKLCKTEFEAIETVESYKNDPRYDSPKYRLSPNGKYYVVYNESTKKILKSIHYNPVSFDSLIQQ